jgi:hypothetical protein
MKRRDVWVWRLADVGVLTNVRFAPEAALGRLDIQLPPYPRNRTQLGNRGMSEMCGNHSGPRLGWPSAGFVGGGPSPFDIFYRFLHAR